MRLVTEVPGNTQYLRGKLSNARQAFFGYDRWKQTPTPKLECEPQDLSTQYGGV